MASIQVIGDNDNETKVIKQSTQGIHNIIVRKQYSRAHGEEVGFCSRNPFDAVKYFAKDHGVEEQNFKTYNDAAMLLKQRQDPSEKLKVSYIGTPEKRDTQDEETNVVERKSQGQVSPRNNTP